LNKRVVIIPTYNEKENIEAIIRKVFTLEPVFDILVVEDNSPDGTAAIVRKLMSEFEGKLFMEERKGKLGLGTAYIHGFKWALGKGYEYIFEMDADFSHNPNDLINLYHAAKDGSDVVIGSRYMQGGGVEKWGIIRRALSFWANRLSRFLLKVPIYDLTSGFKCMKKEVLEKIDFPTMKSKGYAFQIETTLKASIKGLKIVEYPIIFRGRKKDKSKISLITITEAFFLSIFWGAKHRFKKH